MKKIIYYIFKDFALKLWKIGNSINLIIGVDIPLEFQIIWGDLNYFVELHADPLVEIRSLDYMEG